MSIKRKYRKKVNRYNKDLLIQLLQDWVSNKGTIPSRDVCDNDDSLPSSLTYRKYFGSWGNAVRAAGFEPLKSVISPQCREATIKSHKGRRSFNWKGGRFVDNYGYVQVWRPEHPNAKFGKGYIHEHRLVMSEHLSRPLEPYEYVHHKNGIKTDNRLENLELLTKLVHRGQVICPHCGGEFTIR